MNTGIGLGRWAGITVRAHWSVLLVGLVLGSSLARDAGIAPAAIGVVAFLVSILAHEFGHALMARRFDVGTQSIQLWALGGVARLDREAPSAKAEGWIAAAGPLVSTGLALGFSGIWWGAAANDIGGVYVALIGWLGLINAVLAVFNLLPGSPLDGGRIVKAVRWSQHDNRYRATREAARAGEVVAFLLGLAGVVQIAMGSSGVWWLVTAAFIWVNAKLESSGADMAERLDGIQVGDLTWRGLAAAGPDMDADSMLWQRRRLGAAGGVSVFDQQGRPVGIALERDMWAIPAEERPWVMLTQLMVPFESTTRAEADEPLTSILPRLNGDKPVVTVWDGERLVGIIPPDLLDERLGW